MAKGRTTQRMVAIQKWWDDEHQETKLQNRDARTVVAKVLGLAILARYEMKIRCDVQAEMALPATKQVQWDIIEELLLRRQEVGYKDKCLFEDEHIPKTSDSLQKMEDWVLAVKMAIRRVNEDS